MPVRKDLNRREFTNATLMALLGGVSVTVMGCGGSDDTPAAPTPTPSPGDEVGVVQANHGHSAVITSAQLNAGAGVTLTITGTADHPHTVVIAIGEVAQIAANQRVTKTSSTGTSPSAGNHSHIIIFN
jgi:hypothetical protein